MDFLTLSIENFLTIGKAKAQLNNKGLVLIQGVNKDDQSTDSNGAGKSSIPDALCWALYGKTARGVTGDAVINSKAKKNCRVVVSVDDNGTHYTVSRHRKHKEGKNRLTVHRIDKQGNASELTKGTDKLTQALVDEVLGCSHEVFVAAVYAGQEMMPNLPGMTDKQLKVLIEEAAGIDLLQRAYDCARGRLQDAKDDLHGRESELRQAESSKQQVGQYLSELTVQKADWEQKHILNIETNEQRLRALAKEAKSINVDEMNAKRTALQKQVAVFQKKIDSASAERAEERALQDALGEANRYESSCNATTKLKKDELTRAAEAVSRVGDRLGKSCGECGKPYTQDDIAPALKIAERQRDALADELKELAQQWKDSRRSAESASERLSDFRLAMTDISEVIDAQRKLEREIADLDAIERKRNEKISEAKQLVQTIKQLKAETNPMHELIEKTETRRNTAQGAVAAAEAELRNAEKTLQIERSATEVFGPAGVRAHILENVTPFLNERTSHYLGTLSDGNISAIWSTIGLTAKGEMREKFNIDVNNAKGAKSFAGLSGGEKRKVRIATSMALQDLVASRATKPINLFVADEVDDALDKSGLERLMSIMDESARNRGTVLVISHNELSDWIRDAVIVTKENGVSTIEGALS